MKVTVSYPSPEEEIAIMNLNESSAQEEVKSAFGNRNLALKTCEKVYADDSIKHYIRDIVFASRHPESAGIPDLLLSLLWCSPRASISLWLPQRQWHFEKSRFCDTR